MSAACRAAKISRSAYYDWYTNDPDFAARVNDAIEDGTDKLEDSAARQAMQGNSALMSLLLKARRPEKYKDRTANEHTGKDGEPLTIKVVYADNRDGS